MANNLTANVINGKLEYDYTNNEKKKAEAAKGGNMGYDQFLQLLAAEMQYQDPLEPTSNTDYVAQLATFSQLEATLGMQSTITDDMANSLVGKQVVLTETSETTGKTTTIKGVVDYVTYRDGKAFLSVNENLYSIDTLDSVADDSYYEAKEMAGTFSAMLAKLPNINDLKPIYKGAVQDIRNFYDGMTEYQKKYVSRSDVANLEAYEGRIRELTNANVEADISDNFSKTMAALPETDKLTVEYKDRLAAARAAYDDMSETQKKTVKAEDLKKLEALEERMAQLTKSSET